jgi:hypothetical protein
MNADVEAAERLDYPAELINLQTEEHLASALCTLASPRRRACLQQRVINRAAGLSSPLNSALELLAIICRIAGARGHNASAWTEGAGGREYPAQSLHNVLHGVSINSGRRTLGAPMAPARHWGRA